MVRTVSNRLVKPAVPRQTEEQSQYRRKDKEGPRRDTEFNKSRNEDFEVPRRNKEEETLY